MNYLLHLLILLPIISGIFIYLVPKKAGLMICLTAQTGQIAIAGYFLVLARDTGLILNLGSWAPPVGIALYADSLSMSFVLLSSFLFMMFVIFNSSQHYVDRMFYMLYLSLQGMIAGIFLLDDLFSIFILIEVSTIIVSLLIMYKRDSRSMYDGLIYLLINVFSATFFLFGIVVLYKIVGTFSLRLISKAVLEVADKRALFLPYALIITSVSLKAALMPLFSWLPKAHGTPSAPSVVSAVLSGLYVKGGIYLYIRITNAMSVVDVSTFFLISGIITAIVGFLFAISQTDIKLILSYHTVSQLGLIMLAINLGSEEAMYGGIYHMLSHALFKSALFLCAGIIIEKYGTRNVYHMKGVFKTLPVVSVACIGAILGITGAPLFNGAISKYLIAYSAHSALMEWLLVFINFGTVLSFVKFASIFTGERREDIKRPSLRSRMVLITLGVLCLLGGVFGGHIIELLYDVSVRIELKGYFEKSLVYFGTLAVAYIMYRAGITRTKFFRRLRLVDTGFNIIALSLPLFFSVLLTYLLVS